MPQIRYDTQRVAGLAGVYADASPDLWDGLEAAVTTARTLNAQRGDLDAALLAASGPPTPAPTASSALPRIWFGAPRTWWTPPSCSTTTAP